MQMMLANFFGPLFGQIERISPGRNMNLYLWVIGYEEFDKILTKTSVAACNKDVGHQKY
jgi:hypothetical protein